MSKQKLFKEMVNSNDGYNRKNDDFNEAFMLFSDFGAEHGYKIGDEIIDEDHIKQDKLICKNFDNAKDDLVGYTYSTGYDDGAKEGYIKGVIVMVGLSIAYTAAIENYQPMKRFVKDKYGKLKKKFKKGGE